MSKSAVMLFVLKNLVAHRSAASMKSLTCCRGMLFGGAGSSARSRYRFHMISSSVNLGSSELSPGVSDCGSVSSSWSSISVSESCVDGVVGLLGIDLPMDVSS